MLSYLLYASHHARDVDIVVYGVRLPGLSSLMNAGVLFISMSLLVFMFRVFFILVLVLNSDVPLLDISLWCI